MTSEAGKYLSAAVNGGGGVYSILLLSLVASCLETIYVCGASLFLCLLYQLHGVVFCMCVVWVCLVCLLLCKVEGSSRVY